MKKPPSRNILLVCKARHERATALGEEIGTWLRRQGHRATVITAEQDSPAYGQEDLDFVVVLGGDGTMLGVARRLVGRGVPVLGINFGRVGFLTDAQPDQWQDKLVECLYGDEPVRACMALTWSVTRQGGVLASGHGVNDVVLSRGSLARLVSMEIAVNGVRMGALRSDGVIVCTPIGSSGYSVSAGGPLLYPSMEALGFVPICPFLNTIAPMVFDGNTSLTM
jgi:NAD+ kinase